MPDPLHVSKEPKPSFQDLKEVSAVSDRLIHGFMTVSTGALGLSITFRDAIAGSDPTALWLMGLSWVLFTLVILGYMADRLAFFELLRRKAFGIPLMPNAGLFSAIGRYMAMFGFFIGILSLVLFGLLNLR